MTVTAPHSTAGSQEQVDRSERVADRTTQLQTLILVVDDDEQVRNLASTILRLAGFEVLKAASGPEAIQMFERADSSPQLILADVVMPRLSGHQLASQLIAIQPDVKILLMSGYPNFSGFLNRASSRSESSIIDANFIQKPFTPIELLTKVREILGLDR